MISEGRVGTGIERLDELLNGGIPSGLQILVSGPPTIGKETFADQFLVEGLEKGDTCVVIVTDCPPSDIRMEIEAIKPGLLKDKQDKLFFVDLGSVSKGLVQEEKNAFTLQRSTDFTGFLASLAKIGINEKMRVVLRSISEFVLYSDQAATHKFFRTLTAKLKISGIVGLYLLDKGMHTELELQTITHFMDGAIEFKDNDTRTFFSVKGMCDVQTRAWIQCQHSERGLTIGSFSLDHIK